MAITYTFLGTGTSQGVPVIACSCNVCQSKNSKDKRLRTSMLVQSDNSSLVVDTGPDFRQQMLKAGVKELNAAIFTHEHKDHIAGLDDCRGFNFTQKTAFEVYAHSRVQKQIKTEFYYAFESVKYPGVPNIKLNDLEPFLPLSIGNINITPIEVMHYKLPVLGFIFDHLVYITDANYISREVINKIKGCDYLIINALRKEKHISHFTLDEALEQIDLIQPKKHSYITHISHLLGKHDTVNKHLPDHVSLAYDGLTLNL